MRGLCPDFGGVEGSAGAGSGGGGRLRVRMCAIANETGALTMLG